MCAGAVGSPQLLMLSGIGPAWQLRALGIDPVADIAGVGENLQDHPVVKASYAAASPLPRSKYNHGEMYAALRSPLAGAHPDLHLFPILLPVPPGAGYPPPAAGHVLVASAMAPDSRGSVRLASADPQEAPLIDPGFLRDGRDLDRLEAGLLMIREATASLRSRSRKRPRRGPARTSAPAPACAATSVARSTAITIRSAPAGWGRTRRRGRGPGAARPRDSRAAGGGCVGDACHPQCPPGRDGAGHRRASRRPDRRPRVPAGIDGRPSYAVKGDASHYTPAAAARAAA